MEEKKNLEVVSGDGKNLNISPVYEHLNAGKPKSAESKPTNIVIPKEKKDDDDKKDDSKDSKNNEKKEEN